MNKIMFFGVAIAVMLSVANVGGGFQLAKYLPVVNNVLVKNFFDLSVAEDC